MLTTCKILGMKTENQQKNAFEGWVKSNVKVNSAILVKVTYNNIVSHLIAVKDSNKVDLDRAISRRIANNKYQLLNYPSLDLTNILCVPLKEVPLCFSSQQCEFAAQLQKVMENEIPANFIFAFLKRKFPDDISYGKESIDMVQYVSLKLIHFI